MTALIPYIGELIAAETSALGAAGASEMSALIGARAGTVASESALVAAAGKALQKNYPQMRKYLSRKRGKKKKRNARRPRKNRPTDPGIQTLSAPVAMSNIVRTSSRRTNGRGHFTVKHREYLSNQNSTTSPNGVLTLFDVNPGLPVFASWLSGIAYNFEHYRIKSCKLMYLTSCGTDRDGRITLGFIPDNDVNFVPPVNQHDMTAIGDTVSGGVWSNLSMNIPSQGKKLVRTTTLADNEDLSLYDNGIALVMVSGSDVSSSIGDLYIEYEIELMDPVLAAPPTANIKSNNCSAPDFFFGNVAADSVQQGSIPVFAVVDRLYFPPGEFLVMVEAVNTTTPGPGAITAIPSNTAITFNELSRCVDGVDGTTRSSYSVMIVTVSTAYSYLECSAGGTMVSAEVWVSPIRFESLVPTLEDIKMQKLPKMVREAMRRERVAAENEATAKVIEEGEAFQVIDPTRRRLR